ncbi:jg15326, partial [Pararge aegeria aegeria]
EKVQLVKPWIIWTSLQVLVSLLVFVFWSTLSVIKHYGNNSLLIYVVEFLGLTVRFYMLMIVSSFYKHLLERTQEERERLRDLVKSEHWYTAA